VRDWCTGHWHSYAVVGKWLGSDVRKAAIRFGNAPHSVCLDHAYVIMLVLFAPVQSVSCCCASQEARPKNASILSRIWESLSTINFCPCEYLSITPQRHKQE
jgi:hypothetical protein